MKRDWNETGGEDMAYQDDKYHRQTQRESWEHLLGYTVLGRDEEKIGTVKALWEDYTRQPAYLGVATSWLDMGGIHLVPAQFATYSERRQCLRLPFDAEVVKNAPQGHATDEITLSGETKIRDYYYRKGTGTASSQGYAEPATGPASSPARDEKPARSPDWSARDRREEEDSQSFRDRVREAVDEGKAKIYHEAPIAQPVLPREGADQRPREEDDFVPLRREAAESDRRRRDDDREDRPLR